MALGVYAGQLREALEQIDYGAEIERVFQYGNTIMVAFNDDQGQGIIVVDPESSKIERVNHKEYNAS